MAMERKVVDDRLESFFLGLGGDREKYARGYWAYLTGRGSQPDENPAIPANDRQEIRIRLAQAI